MTKKTTTAETSTSTVDAIQTEFNALKADPATLIAPEAEKWHEWISGGRKLVSNPDERVNLEKRYKGAHFNNFYKYIAKEFPNLIFEKDNEHQYFLYDDKTGLYENLTDVFVKELITRLYIKEGFAQKGKVGEVRQTLLRFRAMFAERGIKLEDFDKEEDWFHCANGWLNVVTREFVEHDPQRMSRFKAMVDYNKEALCPNYDTMMKSFALPDDQVRVLHQFSGLCLTGDIRQQKMLVLLGSGDETAVSASRARNVAFPPGQSDRI